MDLFKKFLDNTIQDTVYTYERVDKLAEIYLQNDVVPIAMVESIYKDEYNIRFRIGLTSISIAQLVNRMTMAESRLVFEDDFFIHDQYGYIYGDEARQAFINKMQTSIETAQFKEQSNGAFFMSDEPLMIYGNNEKSKFHRMWDEGK